MKLLLSSILLSTCFIILLAACQPTQVTTNTSSSATPNIVNTPTSVSFPTSFHPPSPTVIQNLLQRVPGELLSLPDGLVIDIYKMTRDPFPDEGYDPFIRSLGEQSRLRSLTQGRYSWDTADLALLEMDNAALAPFGYHLISKPVEASSGARWFTLYQGEKVILDPIFELGQISVNRSGTDFLMIVQAENKFQLVRKGSLEPWKFLNGTIANSRPQFLRDDLMHVEINGEMLTTSSITPEPSKSTVKVFRNGHTIYTMFYQDPPAASGFRGFWTYNDHWALETIDQIVIDGQDVNALNGYDKSYEFHLLGGKPLFFFEKSGKLSISFDGKIALLPFQSIPHYGCCSAGLTNPMQIGNILIFYGMKDGNWFYVEMTNK